MSNKTKIFSDAIAEAKVIKETALSNAKLAMAESFSPQIKEMLSSQLNEMEEEYSEETQTLEELLNSLEEGEGENFEDETLIGDEEIGEEEIGSDFDLGADELGDETGLDIESSEEPEGDTEVADITVDQLKDIIRSLRDEDETLEDEEIPDLDFEDEEISDDIVDDTIDATEEDDELNLNEIFGEIEEMGGGSIDGANAAAGGLDNIITQVKQLISKSPDYASKIAEFLKGLPSGASSAMRAEATQLAESKAKIKSLNESLSKVNLLNSKLLYVNKLFKASNLNESQKVKAINAMDRATTVKESENIFLTLKESLVRAENSKPLHENRGRASRPAGIAQKPNTQILTEDVDFVTRMQKLAGIL